VRPVLRLALSGHSRHTLGNEHYIPPPEAALSDHGCGRPGDAGSGLTLAAISEDEERLWDLQINMDHEEGCLWVYGDGEDGVPAFSCLRPGFAD